MRGKAVAIALEEAERAELSGLTRGYKTAQALARRARIVSLASEGLTNRSIGGRPGLSPHTVGTWRERFAARRLDGLYDEPRPGTPRKIGDEAIAETIRLTLETMPAGATHWSLRSMTRATGYAPSTIHDIWKAFGLQPHRSETFKALLSEVEGLSADPLFVEKPPRRRAAARQDPPPATSPYTCARRSPECVDPRSTSNDGESQINSSGNPAIQVSSSML